MQPCDAAAASKAFRTTSVTRWLVSTLPPTTAASGLGLSRQPVGILTVMGARQPCVSASGKTAREAGLPSGGPP
eukprot:360341-Chlamydomonas_euryale.AAC.12